MGDGSLPVSTFKISKIKIVIGVVCGVRALALPLLLADCVIYKWLDLLVPLFPHV